MAGANNGPKHQQTQSIASQALGPASLGQSSGITAQLRQEQQLQALAVANANHAERLDRAFSSGLHGLGGLNAGLWNYNLSNGSSLSGGFPNADVLQQQANLLQQEADLRRGGFDLTANMSNLSTMDRGLVSQLQDAAYGGSLGADALGNVMDNLRDGLDNFGLSKLGLGNQQALSNAALAAQLSALQAGYGGNLSEFGLNLTGVQAQADLLNDLSLGLLQNNLNNLPLQQELQLRELQNLSAFGQNPQLQVAFSLSLGIDMCCRA